MTIKYIINTQTDLDDLFIEYRTNSPIDNEKDMFFGAASYYKNHTELISEDGDDYSINDEIQKYEWRENEDGERYLVVWITSTWDDNGEQYINAEE